jgi:hypothetical protein
MGIARGLPALTTMIAKSFYRYAGELFTSKRVSGIMGLTAVIGGY